MPYKMTINEALTIQRAQLAWYRQAIGRAGVKAIRARTKLPNINPDKPMFIGDVNKYIPRGGSFEPDIRQKAFRSIRDHEALSWHDGIRRGIIDGHSAVLAEVD